MSCTRNWLFCANQPQRIRHCKAAQSKRSARNYLGRQAAPSRLVTRKAIISLRELRYLVLHVGSAGPAGGFCEPHRNPTTRRHGDTATRRLIPTENPRTKRHTPVHLLCLLKARRIAVSGFDARELGCWSFSRQVLYQPRSRWVPAGSVSVPRGRVA
jgi:hypothetical protein